MRVLVCVLERTLDELYIRMRLNNENVKLNKIRMQADGGRGVMLYFL